MRRRTTGSGTDLGRWRPVVSRSDGPPQLQVDLLRAAAARRVDVPGDDVSVLRDADRRVDEEDGALDAVLVLAPVGRVAQVPHRIACRKDSEELLASMELECLYNYGTSQQAGSYTW